MTRQSVQAGYCVWPDTVGCAFTKSECDDPSNFISSRQMQGGPVNAHGGSCRWQSSVKETVLGKCTAEDGVQTECASNINACPNWDGDHLQRHWIPNDTRRGWEGPVQECTVETTPFGRCDDGMCAWSHKHCMGDETWQPFDEDCTCDKVQVGACARTKDDGTQEVFCAVSEDGCDEEQSWIIPQGTFMEAGFDCFLCREESPAAKDVSSSVGLVAEDFDGSSSAGLIAEELETFGTGGNNTQTIVTVVATAGVLLAFAIIGLVGWKAFRTRRAVKRAAEGGFVKEAEAPPATIVKSSDNLGNDAEAASGIDMDNFSILSEE